MGDRYAYGKNIQIFGLRTDARIVQRSDEPINLMILESLSELSPTIELVHTILCRGAVKWIVLGLYLDRRLRA